MTTLYSNQEPATTTQNGLMPAIPGDSTKFLNGNGTYSTPVDSAAAWGQITGTLSNQIDLQAALDNKVTKNTAITGATKTKITYDTKGLITSGADATTADIADSSNKRYVTDTELTYIASLPNISGNAATVTTNANLTGPITSVGNATSIASQTGTGTKFVVDTSPTLVTPNIGTPSAGVLTNCTGTASGLTAGTVTTNANLTGAVTSVGNATSLGSFSSANLATALTDETGSGSAVFATSPTLVTPALGTPSSGVLTNCTGTASGLTAGTVTTNANLTGVITSSGNATSIASQTGTGTKFVVDTSPVLVTPTIGVATATSVNKVAITAPATSATLTIANSKTLTASNTLTFTGTDGSSVACGGGGTVAYTANNLSVFAATTSSQLAGVISDETGSGSLVFATSPTFTTPLLGTPTSGTLTNCTGLPEGGLSLTDITTNNSSTSKHGFLPKLDNSATHFLNGQGGWTTPSGTASTYAVIADHKTKNTEGGTFTSGAWRTRDLNTEVYDGGRIVSIASNQFTVAAGTYVFISFAPAYKVESHQSKIYDITNSADLVVGSTEYSPSGTGGQSSSICMTQVTVAGSTTYEIRHYCTSTTSTVGFGVPGNIDTECYTQVYIIKL